MKCSRCDFIGLYFNIFGSSTWVNLLGYCLYDPSTHEVIESTNVIFDEVLINPAKFGDVFYVPEVGGLTIDASFCCDVKQAPHHLDLVIVTFVDL